MSGYWETALHDVVTLVGELQNPDSPHQLKAVITFSERARAIDVAELADIEWEFVYGSNIASALHLALAELDGELGLVVIFSDMQATAHIADDGDVFFSYPPDRTTTKKTVQAVSDCLASGMQLDVRRYRDDIESNPDVEALMGDVIRLGGQVSEIIVPTT